MRERQHKFSVGRSVGFCPDPGIGRNSPRGEYKVTKLLPERNGEFEYRIKSNMEPSERVARESQLNVGAERKSLPLFQPGAGADEGGRR